MSASTRAILRNFAQITLLPDVFSGTRKKNFGSVEARRRRNFSTTGTHTEREKIFLRVLVPADVGHERARIFFHDADALRLAGRINTGLARLRPLPASSAAALRHRRMQTSIHL